MGELRTLLKSSRMVEYHELEKALHGKEAELKHDLRSARDLERHGSQIFLVLD